MATTETIVVGSDHAAFDLKGQVVSMLRDRGHEVLDVGTDSTDPVDYPDIAAAVGGAIQRGEASRGVLLCGSGAGASIAANKLHGIRAAVCHDTYSAHQAVEHDDMNVLCLGARVIGCALVEELVDAWLPARFAAEGRFQRRFDKVLALESSGTTAS